ADGKSVPVTAGHSIGQTFTTGPDVAELHSISIQSVLWGAEWGEGTTLVLRLYDNPEKTTKLAEFAMRYEWRCWDGGKIVFPVGVEAKPNRTYYTELTASGGDGKAGIILVSPVDYAGGTAYVDGKQQSFDIIFETYTRPVFDRDRLYTDAFAKIDLAYPGMEKVRDAVGGKDWDIAAKELVRYFENRADLLDDTPGKTAKRPEKNPNIDLTDAKLALNMQVRDPDGQIISLGPGWCHLRWWPKRGGVGLTREGIRKHLANGYLNLGDEAYARAWNVLLKSFFVECPSQLKSGILPKDAKEAPALFEGGIGGARMWDGLALAARLRHQFWYYMIFAKSPEFTWDVRAAFIFNLPDMAEVLYIQKGGGNWEDQMSFGLFEFGRQFHEFTRWKDVMQKGFDRMTTNMRATMLPDGPMGEAPNYQMMVHNQYRQVVRTAQGAGLAMPFDLAQKVEKAYEYHMYTIQPDGGRPAFGDSIGADSRPFLMEGARQFGRQDMMWVATDGKEGKMPEQTSTEFPDARYFVMRSDWSPDARYLCLRSGEYGHGHQDSLGFILHAYGNPQIIDPGVYVYGTPDTVRLISTRSHSTIQVDGRDLLETNETNEFFAGKSVDFLKSDGPCYNGLDKSIHAVRRVVFLKPDYWVVSDVVEGIGRHQIDSRFHFLDLNAELDKNSAIAYTKHPSGGNLEIVPVDRKALSFEMEKADHSLIFEKLTPALILKQSANADLPFRIDNVLYPYKLTSDAHVSRLKLAERDAACSGIQVKTSKGVDYILFVGESAAKIDAGPMTANAQCATVRTGTKGSIRSFGWMSGTEVGFGKTLARSSKPVKGLDVAYEGDVARVTSSGEEPTLEIAANGAKSYSLNGSVPRPITRSRRFFLPFGQDGQ
ncbi:MAG: alginate lyase family protein, partial [Armatimonadota bacterium]